MDGVGKTTLVNQLKSSVFYISIEIHERNKLIKDTLEAFSKNEINDYFFQIIFFYSNLRRYKTLLNNFKNSKDQRCLSDRSFLEDIIFAEALLPKNDFEIYKKLYFYHLDLLIDKYEFPTCYFILESTFEVCKRRIKKKLEEEMEKDITWESFLKNIAYYKKLFSLYENKNSLFFSILRKYNISLKTLTTSNFSIIETYEKAKQLLDIK